MFSVLCNTFNIVKMILSQKKKIAHAKYVCYSFIDKIIIT